MLNKADKLVLDDANIEPGLLSAINKFATMVRGTGNDLNTDQSLYQYARYVLESGSEFEQTRLIRNISNKLAIHNRTLIEI